VSARKQSYQLKHDIVLDKRNTEGVESEEVVKAAGETITVRRPKAKDLQVFDHGGPMGGVLALLKRVTSLSDLEADNLDGEDFDALGELVAPGSKSGPPIGGTA